MAREQPADLFAALAEPLPATIICEMLGIPLTERKVCYAWVLQRATTIAPTAGEREAATKQAADYLLDLFARRRAEPADDLVTALVQVHDEDGDRLSERELLTIVLTLFAAGQETTSSQLSKSLVLLFRHRGQWDRLVADPGLVPGAVEEMLRVVRIGPSTFTRVALTDVELSGGTVAAGETVFPVLPAANYDPAVFPDPDRIDVSRANAGSHLTFGHGMHYCLGAPLARLELAAAMQGLVTRFPTLHLAVPETELIWTPNSLVAGPMAMPVAW
jgi:cytochrome P450